MRRDSRLSVTLHVLLHMSQLPGAVTSEVLASMMKSNPVLLRRTMAGLRDAGIVRSEKGHGGGWSLARDLKDVTLAEVHAALGVTTVFSVGLHDPSPRCLLERSVNKAIGSALSDAEALFLKRLRNITVAEVLACKM